MVVAQLNQIDGGGPSSKTVVRPSLASLLAAASSKPQQEKREPVRNPDGRPVKADTAKAVAAQRAHKPNWGSGAPGGPEDPGPDQLRYEAERTMRSWDDAKSDEQRQIDGVREDRELAPRTRLTNSKGQVNRGPQTPLNVLLKRADGPDLGTQLKELDWDSYNKLDVNQRSRVDVNTLLTQAIDRDQMLLGGLDRNRDGKVTAAEAGDEAEGYRSTYESVFGAHRGTERDLEFAPHTVAALSLLGAEALPSDLGEYLAGNRFVTETELSDRADRPTGPGQRPSESAVRESSLAESMARVAVALDQGRGLANGAARPVNFGTASNEQFGAFVESLRADMKAGKQLGSLLSSTGQTDLSVDALANDSDLEAIVAANPAFDNMYGKLAAAPEVLDDDFTDEEFMRAILEPQGYTDYSAWERFVQAKRGLEK